MSTDYSDQRKKRTGRAWRSVGAVARNHYLTITAAVLAVTLGVVVAPRALSSAASAPAANAAASTPASSTPPSDDGVTWNPEEVTQNNDGGTCDVTFSGSIATPDITAVTNALGDVPQQDINMQNTKDYGIENIGATDTAGTPVTGQANVDCSIVQTAFLTGPGSIGPGSARGLTTAQLLALTRPDGVSYEPDPGGSARYLSAASDPDIYLTDWFTGAIADVAATAAYIAISAVTIGTFIALGATLGPAGELASATLGALAGCIGGAVSTSVLLAIGGGSTSPYATLTNAVAGCVTGAALSQIPVHEAGQWLARQFNASIGSGSSIAGSALNSVTSSPSVPLTSMGRAMQDAISGLNGI